MSWVGIARTAGYLFYLPLIWFAGNWFCRLVFRLATVKVGARTAENEAAYTLNAGRYIGLFERLLISIGVVTQLWEMLVAVIALKSVARYPELDKRIGAEYFLVGSLASLFWAVLVAGALLAYDAWIGFGMFRP
jgi:hypothetical protein